MLAALRPAALWLAGERVFEPGDPA